MIRGFDLIAKVLTLRAPPVLLVYAVRNKLDRMLKTGNRRFEFERRYLEFPDPWNYHSSPYEHAKYEHTLARALEHAPSAGRALEIGCSIGVFTRMLAQRFAEVTAVDVSKEAVAAARKHTEGLDNIDYVVGDLRTLELSGVYDVIFCAEVLSYIPKRDADQVVAQLARYLRLDGVMIMVTLHEKPAQGFFYFDEWEQALAPALTAVSKETVDDPVRPYEVVLFAHPAATGVAAN